jgi:hypothetical protein
MSWWVWLLALGMIAVPAACTALAAHYAGEARRDRIRVEGALKRVGRCGETAPMFFNQPAPTCSLPAGHAGWHHADNDMEWSEAPESDWREVVPGRREYAARQQALAQTPTYVHRLLDAFLNQEPLNFGHAPVPSDIQARLKAAKESGQLGSVPADGGADG